MTLAAVKVAPLAVVLILVASLVFSGVAQSTSPGAQLLGCGQAITSSVTLHNDIGPCAVDGLDVSANNVNINCAGHTITGTGTQSSFGILVAGATNVHVNNCHIIGFYFDVGVVSSARVSLLNSVADSATGYGIWVFSSTESHFINNTVRDSSSGFLIQSSSNNLVQNNTSVGNPYNGFTVVYTGSPYQNQGNKFVGNLAEGNAGYGFCDLGQGNPCNYPPPPVVGFANTYQDNVCIGNNLGGSYPANLCSP